MIRIHNKSLSSAFFYCCNTKIITMKKILMFMAFLSVLQSANAQIRLDFQAGLASPSGDAFEYSKNLGLGYGLDVMYAPCMILDGQLSFGFEKSGNLLLTASGDWKDKGVDLSASKLGFWGVKARFDLDNDGPSPYGAISLGLASLKSYYIYEDYNPDGSGSAMGSNDFETGCLKASRFAVKPELGVAFGWFTFGVGWLLPGEFRNCDKEIARKAGAIQYNIGLRIKID